MTPRTRRILTVGGVLVGFGVAAWVGYGVARAAARPTTPRFPSDPSLEPLPLRPDPPAADEPPPGPLAKRLADLVTELDDDELQAVRNSMPSHWWQYVGAATRMPDDELFAFALQPLAVDMWLWSDEQRATLQGDLVASMGLGKALALQSILKDGGVL